MPTIDQCSRRRLLSALGTCATGALAGCVVSSETNESSKTDGSSKTNVSSEVDANASSATDWPTVGYDRANRRYSPSGTPLAHPTKAWSTPIETPVRQPVLADGRVYMPDQSVLRVYDAATGEELWQFSNVSASRLITAPTVRDGVAYLGTASESESVVALDAKTGDQLWTRGGKQIGAVYGTPTLGENGNQLYVGTTRARIYSLDAKTGETRWQNDVFGPIKNTLAVRSPLVVATTSAGEVYAFKENGEAIWRQRFPGGSGSSSPPTLSDRWIFVGCNNNCVYCLAPVSGSVQWKTHVDRLHRDGFVTTDSSVYAISGSNIVAIGNKNGEVQWSIGLGASVSCTPMIVNDTLFVGGPRISALKSSGGYSIANIRFDSTHWTRNVGSHVGPGMAAGNGRLFTPVRMNDASAELLALEEK
jgi:outer membrane protein assembly factor BamB